MGVETTDFPSCRFVSQAKRGENQVQWRTIRLKPRYRALGPAKILFEEEGYFGTYSSDIEEIIEEVKH